MARVRSFTVERQITVLGRDENGEPHVLDEAGDPIAGIERIECEIGRSESDDRVTLVLRQDQVVVDVKTGAFQAVETCSAEQIAAAFVRLTKPLMNASNAMFLIKQAWGLAK